MDDHKHSDDSSSDSDAPRGTPDSATPASRPHKVHKSEREKRTYRACLHCRQRKSRCDLYSSGEPGRPPCERCIREQHECILGGSRRGGRRVKRSTVDAAAAGTTAASSSSGAVPPASVDSSLPPPNAYYNSTSTSSAYPPASQRLPDWNTLNPEPRTLPPIAHDGSGGEAASIRVEDNVASTDLQNPADALEFLAHVAERNSEGAALPSLQRAQPTMNHAIDYPPLNKGKISLQMMHALLSRFRDKYHPFFPLANPAALDPMNLPTTATEEKHLLAAVLTVASKDEEEWWQVHEDCSAHMQTLVASLVYTGTGSVEAVEAMLILAEWVPRPARSTSTTIGRGEEDQAAWMYVGTAIRLGYLLGIDRTGFRAMLESQTADLNRKRLAWANCYMSDRQISVRIGKAFWSRGPGPMTSLEAQDFPSLRSTSDNFAAIFEANLSLTQLFSNAHDVLYATKSRSNQLNAGGEYVKYIDDFRVSLRHWNEKWGLMHCSEPLKASLILSYEYLRLYVNAFAYQATLNRLLAQMRQNGGSDPRARPQPASFLEVAYAPDARFIYDSVDAARTLLHTFCSQVDPENTFRYMPLRYYLYIIYSAVFLYKARSTGIMGASDRSAVKELIPKAIEHLQRSSACPHDVGDRYAKLIRLLWSRRPGRGSVAAPHGVSRAAELRRQENPGRPPVEFPNPMEAAPPSINTFSWLDLGSVGNFALENTGTMGSGRMDSLDHFDDSSADGFSQTQFDMYMPNQYSLNDFSPSGGIIF